MVNPSACPISTWLVPGQWPPARPGQPAWNPAPLPEARCARVEGKAGGKSRLPPSQRLRLPQSHSMASLWVGSPGEGFTSVANRIAQSQDTRSQKAAGPILGYCQSKALGTEFCRGVHYADCSSLKSPLERQGGVHFWKPGQGTAIVTSQKRLTAAFVN